ncbi:hypothetical protein GCM10018790_56560 [Kitasatospora xanthocidica]|uniref:hypothetical protein n=1 Tax=Kitasatospora xanthocidica TaxID=83382 RepID=UPI00167535A9|nr:hypothetical protein [Kitasatospora xanthocidica]GHF71384.1 hypothetical protein GCM10018790_56560 [Kitasatospora xanthocidica]
MRRTRALTVLIALILSLAAPPAAARESGPPPARPPAAPAEVLTQVIGDPVAVPRSNVHVFYEASVTCPAGQTPTGGGPKVSPYDNPLEMISSYPRGNGWVVTVDGGSDVDATLWATVICSTEPHTQVSNGPVTIAPQSEGGLSATCPAGQYATGGGGLVDLGVVHVYESFAGGNEANDRWTYYINNPAGRPLELRPFVICSTSPHHHYWGDGTKLPFSHGTAHDLKYCPSGTVTGGGALAIGTAVYESSFWGNGWLAQAVNYSGDHPEVRANVVCKD